ncbi:MAG: hypothetical protein IT541_11500 [Hyphomicrobiales bacterium]|nr:hypothetical protein [Hyphomicrobiales bacterium]
MAPISKIASMIAIVAAFLPQGSAQADTANGYAVDHGVAIYYALAPAEMIAGHPTGHAEAEMHGGVPASVHAHHLIAALFDAKSFERITDAKITATVGEVGLATISKELEPFTVNGALTYGNYFEFRPRTQYRVHLTVARNGATANAETEFEFDHE